MYTFFNQQFASDSSSDRSNPFSILCEFFRAGLVDRTRSISTPFECRILNELTPDKLKGQVNQSFSEICLDRAKTLLEEASRTKKSISLLWSGGIDSTTALVALIQASKELGISKDLIQIHMTASSIEEYPSFYADFIKGDLKVKAIGGPIPNFIDLSNSLIVTGELGDQLFGSDKILPHIESGLINDPWESSFQFLIAEYCFSSSDIDNVMNYIRPLVEASPKKIESLFDLLWWLNFTLKWQHVSLRIAVEANDDTSLFHEATRHFFDNEKFELWAISQIGKRKILRKSEYKMAAKDFIFQFTGDAEYRNRKLKEPSLFSIYAGEKNKKKKEELQSSAQSNIAHSVMLDEKLNFRIRGE